MSRCLAFPTAYVGVVVPERGQVPIAILHQDAPALRALYPERQILHEVSADVRLVVSERVGDPPGARNEVPESSYGVVGHGAHQLRPFKAKPPTPVAVSV